MSVWTHVYCEIRTPKAMNFEELQKAFGKECLYEWNYNLNLAYEKLHGKEALEKAIEDISNYNQKLAEEYDKDPKAFLPCGSEGSLSYMRDIWELHSEDGRFKYIITGNLRDYSDDIGIVKWFCNKFLEWIHDLTDVDKNLVYGYVLAGMGAGEFSWQYGPKDIREVGENEMNKLTFYDEERSLRERFIREFTPMVDGRGNSMTIKGIFNGLMRAADKSTTQEPHLFIDWFMNLNTGDFINVSGFGPEKVIVCRDIQEKIRNNGDLLDKLLANCKTVR